MIRQFFFLFLLSLTSFAQKGFIETELVSKTSLNVDKSIGIDKLGSNYYTIGNTLYKITKKDTLNYSNYQLGDITTINIFNPLKISLFYQEFNTAVILDNRLSEILKIDFNTKTPYKNISHISTGFDNTLWVFNQEIQALQLYNYKTNRTLVTTLPVESEVLSMVSNYNQCWLLTEKFLYTYNYQGSLISKMKNEGFTHMYLDNGNILLKRKNHLFFMKKNSDILLKIKTPELLIKQFYLTNETLYIYDLNFLYQLQLKL